MGGKAVVVVVVVVTTVVWVAGPSESWPRAVYGSTAGLGALLVPDLASEEDGAPKTIVDKQKAKCLYYPDRKVWLV